MKLKSLGKSDSIVVGAWATALLHIFIIAPLIFWWWGFTYYLLVNVLLLGPIPVGLGCILLFIASQIGSFVMVLFVIIAKMEKYEYVVKQEKNNGF